MLPALAIPFAFGTDAAAASMPEASDGNREVDVWLIAGQSNAIGQAYISNYPSANEYSSYKDLLTNGSSNVWYYGNRETDAFVPAGFGHGSNTSSSGPEIGLTTALNGNGRTNAIIKLAYGNTSLYNNTTSNESIKYGTWTPPSYIEKHSVPTTSNRTGDLYLSFIKKVEDGLNILTESGYTPVIKGIYYMQGEADTFGAASSSAYTELLTTLISDLRNDLSKVSGTDCSALPFVYGRIHRNPEVPHGSPDYLAAVQGCQDTVSKNTSLKNVSMIDFRTDLFDPVTKERRDPVQQDGWHYDSLTQQMIGEAAIKKVADMNVVQTRYGNIPAANVGSNPFAIFKRSADSYIFDSCRATTTAAINRAVELTHASSGTTDEAVILLLKNYGSGDYGANVAKSGGTITLDLGGYALHPSVALFTTDLADTVASGETAQKKTVFNIKNGEMKFQQFGIMFTTGNTSIDKTIEMNIDNVKFGFISGTENAAQETYKYRDLLVSDRNCTATNGAKVTINVNVTNSELDLVTNAQSNATIGTLKENNSNNACYTDYNLVFEGCTFTAKSPDALNGVTSSSGDSVTFIKGADGTYSKVILPSGTYNQQFDGIDDGIPSKAILRTKGETVDAGKIYYLTTGSDLETEYGTIPAAYTNALSNPYAIFKKINGKYEFDSSKNSFKTAVTRATELTNAANGTTDDVVILLRYDIQDRTYAENVSDIGGTVTIDLCGHTINNIFALFRTDIDDCLAAGETEQKKCVINFKNGALNFAEFGMFFTTTNSNYTKEKTFEVNIDNVRLGFGPNAKNYNESAKGVDILVSDRNAHASTKSYFKFKLTDCTVDLITNTGSKAYIGTLRPANDKTDSGNSRYNIEMIGGTVITGDISRFACRMSAGGGDSFTLKRDADGNYPKVLMPQNLAEPDSKYLIDGEGGLTVSCCETQIKEGTFKVYELREGVSTPYGQIPYAASQSDFALFIKNGNTYTFSAAYINWKTVFEAAVSLTKTEGTEVVAYLLRDNHTATVPYYASDIAGIVNLDLGGKALTVSGSFFNTWFRDSASPTGTINIKNGTLLTTKYGLVYSGLGTNEGDTYTTEKTINMNFENVYLGFGANVASGYNNLLTQAQVHHDTVNSVINMKFDGCTIDLYNNISESSYIGRAKFTSGTNSNVDYIMSFKNSEFLVHSPDQLSYSYSNAGEDMIYFVKGDDGKYPTVLTADLREDYFGNRFDGLDGEKKTTLKLQYSGIGIYGIYDMLETSDTAVTIPTAYGNIPPKFASKEAYPIVLFTETDGEWEFNKAYATLKEAMIDVFSITAPSNKNASDVVILLRRNLIEASYPTGTSKINRTVTVDLNGFVLEATQSLGNTATQDVTDYNGNKVATNGTVIYKNGSILSKQHGLIYAQNSGSYTAGYEKTLNFVFENVYIGFSSGAVTPTLIGRVAGNHTTAYNTINFTFRSCTLDMVTNRSTKAGLLLANWVGSGDYTKVNTEFESCDFIGLTESDAIMNMTSGNDTVKYTRGEGKSNCSLTLPATAAAPTLEYNLDGASAVFVAVSEIGETVTYKLRPKDAANVSFVPKMSVSLDSDLIINVYIPAKSLLKFTFDGENYNNLSALASNKTVIDGKEYYKMEAPLSAKEAARDVILTATVDLGGKSANGTFTFSIVKYAQSVLSSSSTDIEKRLVLDVLSYVRSAYIYFGTNDYSTIAKMNDLLGSAYDKENAPKMSGSAAVPTVGLKAATFVLNATPAVRFYLSDGADASKYSFFAEGRKLYGTYGTDANGAYVEISAYAYLMGKTIEYSIGGTPAGSYHIRSYYEFAKTQNDAKLTSLVERFAKYCESAEDYRLSVIEK